MDCSQLMARFTDHLDGSVTPEEASAMERHLAECASCGRYRTVLERGSSLLRSLPQPQLREDFEPRLRHRIYHVDDERALSAHQSGTPALTVLGIAILLTALAWAPLLRGGPRDVVLEPIVVDRSPREASSFLPVIFAPPGTQSSSRPGNLEDGLWENTLLYDYSALSQRYDRRARLRRASDFDR